MQELDTILSGSQPLLTHKSVAKELPTPTRNVVHDALAQGLKAVVSVLVDENFWNREVKRGKEHRDCLLEEVHSYKKKKKKLEKAFLEKEIELKSMLWSLVDLEGNVSYLKAQKSLLMNADKVLPSCLL